MITTNQRLQRARAEIALWNRFIISDTEIDHIVKHLGDNMYGDRMGNKWTVRTCPDMPLNHPNSSYCS